MEKHGGVYLTQKHGNIAHYYILENIRQKEIVSMILKDIYTVETMKQL